MFNGGAVICIFFDGCFFYVLNCGYNLIVVYVVLENGEVIE